MILNPPFNVLQPEPEVLPKPVSSWYAVFGAFSRVFIDEGHRKVKHLRKLFGSYELHFDCLCKRGFLTTLGHNLVLNVLFW